MPKLLVGDVLRSTTRKFPNKTGFVFEDKRMTYATFENRVNRLANGLLSKGHQPGDHIAILAYNCIEYYEILFAMAKVGIVAVPMNFRFSDQEITYVVNHSDAIALIYDALFRERISHIRPDFGKVKADNYIVFDGNGPPGDLDYEKLVTISSPEEPDIPLDETMPWYIGYTSGTTGRPKGAVRSHRSNMLQVLNTFYCNKSGDVILLIMPTFHSNSIWYGLRSVYSGAAAVIYPSGGFNPTKILETIEREKITFTSMVPTMYTLILQVPDKEKYDISSCKTLLCSSAPLMTRTKERILEFFKGSELYEGYGSTEAGGVTMLFPKDQYRKVRSCGQPNRFTRVKILDEEGNECNPGEVGELFSISPGMFDGYYKQPKKDNEAFLGEWLSVGDMCKVDEEGYYYIVDRKHDMIISGGENIYPTEIDDLLSKHPKISQAFVIGVPDEKWGESAKAMVVLKPGEKLTEDEVILYCRTHLARYKCPKSVEFWKSLPTNPVGKILKQKIREKFWEGQEGKI